MSGGQRQRALARALVIRPRVLLMDEPLSNLDAKMRLQMRDVILDLVREAGITTVFVTHDQEEALAMSDRIAIMDHGRIAQLGTPEELYGTPVNAYVADFIGSANVIPVPAQAVPGQAPQGLVRYQLCGRDFDGVQGAGSLDARGVLIARPEELALMAPAPYVPNTLPGRCCGASTWASRPPTASRWRTARNSASNCTRAIWSPVPARRGRAGADPRRQPGRERLRTRQP